MRRLIFWSAVVATIAAVVWWAPFTPGQVSVPLFFAGGPIALLWVTRRRARKAGVR
jgi:membrane protein implicated in regulation of membrane protease activity